MARKFLVPIDLNNNELRNALAQLLGSAPTGVEGKFYYDTTDKVFSFYNGTAWVDLGRLDQISAPTADVSLNSQKITNLGTPSAATDAATKGYVDTAVTGLSWKDSVRVATTAAGTLASSFENGDTVDGITLATGDRILIKNQSAGEENGIYVVAASGAPTRASDADSAAELRGAAVMVEEGSSNENTQWIMTTDSVTLGTTPLTWTQFGGSSAYTAGDGLTLTGNDFDVNVANGIEIVADAVQIENGGVLTVPHGGTGASSLTDHSVLIGSGTGAVTPITVGATGEVLKGVTGSDPAFGAVDLTADVGSSVLPIANGGTNANSAANAKTQLGFMTRVTGNIGDNSATTIDVTHNLGTKDVIAQLRQNSDDAVVEADIIQLSTTQTRFVFAVAPATNALRYVIIG